MSFTHPPLSYVSRTRVIPRCVMQIVCSLLFASSGGHVACGDDNALPTGLVIHLDATTLDQVRVERGMNPIATGDAIDSWPDSTSHHHDFLATTEASRPTWNAVGSRHVVRFDGVDDSMRCLSGLGELKGATIWLVVVPYANPGDFRGFLAANAPQERDYVSGLNIDLGPGPSRQWDMLNIEGRGFSGVHNFLSESQAFGPLRLIEVQIDANGQTLQMHLDGQRMGTRATNAPSIAADEWTLGARYYTNGPGAQQVRGSLRCDMVEVMVFDRCLSAEESSALREHLIAKHAELKTELMRTGTIPDDSTPLVLHENPPAVQMLVPGFDVRRLPVDLPNINNVRYRRDGALVALAYNGDVYILRDMDGDSLEEDVQVFFKNNGQLLGPIGMQCTSENDPRGQGVFVASKGKVSLLVDRNGDDQCDEEVVIASGWDPLRVNVDAVGLAVGPDGAIYFGLGTADYANAYQVDDQGNSRYSLSSDHGTIQRIAPDLQSREIVCTGVRFPIGIAFHRNGDLFCTDQEGATWLPNGNPFDELLHIQKGKHYGFPPRHPKYNPTVIDEPSVFDYSPQHQSTCGMFFNGSIDDPSRFGPIAWADNALVCGESRGKLWRTELAKTDAGYVAQSQLLACLQMLTVDACNSPAGELVVACHSGPPDWGTGPAGTGTLFKIRPWSNPVPRPVLAWFSSQGEINVAFDLPLDPMQVRQWSNGVRVDAGKFVRAGDRYETLVPPYAVVQAQSMEPRRQVAVSGAGLTPDLRTLILQVPPQAKDECYAITIPTVVAKAEKEGGIAQRHEMEIDLQLHGIVAHWQPADPRAPTWSGWLPHLELNVARALTQHSAEHELLWQMLERPGILTLQTELDLRDVLRPKIQPGSTIDYAWPDERVYVSITGSVASIKTQFEQGTYVESTVSSNPLPQRIMEFAPKDGEGPRVEIELKYTIRSGQPWPSISFYTEEDPTPRALPLHRFRLPWANRNSERSQTSSDNRIVELEGGNWGRGRKLFYSEIARCSKCHTEPGSGLATRIGPDLSNLVHRDYKSVVRDIVHPSYAINPEFIGHQIRLSDDTVLTGVLRDEEGKWVLGDSNGNSIPIVRDTIETMKPSSVSVMPEGLIEKLSSEQQKDLVTYLMKRPPRMPLENPNHAPKVRTVEEVAKVLEGSAQPESPYRPLNVLLVAGPKDHGPDEHDYPAWLIQWGQLLAAAESVTIDAAWEFPSETQMAAADVIIFFQKGAWNTVRAQAMDSFFDRGGGAVYLHWAINGDDQVQEFSRRIGLASWGGNIRYRHGPLQLHVENSSHPILRNVEALDLLDESYWLLTGKLAPEDVLATSLEDGEPRPQLWTHRQGNGRVFVSIPGHYSWTFDDPIFRTVLLRGIAWTANEPIDRFNELVLFGARIKK